VLSEPYTPKPERLSAAALGPIVEFDSVSKSFPDQSNGGRVETLVNLSLSIGSQEAGAFVVLLGPSGCGKSTILSLISGLLLPDDGQVRVFSKRIKGPSPYSVTVPQAYTCFPWLTILKNVEFGLAIQGEPGAERREKALRYLHQVGLGDRSEAYPRQLSGGMQQRVAIARTLAMKPKIVLMDEPFGALDAQTRTEMQQMLLGLWEKEKNTIIFVTHDITEALLLADRIIVFSSRPARVILDLRNLDKELGHQRPPSLVKQEAFMRFSDELREKLKRPATDVR
jgi:NitT/TauT family transport system ATP-binding protein